MRNIKFWRILNVVVWIGIVVLIMTSAYNSWSTYGEYTIADFFGSLVFHGGFGFLIGYVIDGIIKVSNK